MKLLPLALLLTIPLCSTTLLRLACGGPGGADPQGNVWQSDAPFTSGPVTSSTWTQTNQPALATQPAPYNALRYSAPPGSPFSYVLQLDPGQYSIRLLFVEPNKTAAGQRVFSVAINSTPVLLNLDLFAVAGTLKPYERTFQAVAIGGQITIVLTAVAGNAVISGIQVDSVDPPPTTSLSAIYCRGGVVSGPVYDVTGAYREEACYNDTGAPLTVSHVRCYTDSGGSSTLDLQNWLGVSYLTAPIQCDQKWKEGVLANIKSQVGDLLPNLLDPEDWIIFIFTSDGSPKRAGWQVRLTP